MHVIASVHLRCLLVGFFSCIRKAVRRQCTARFCFPPGHFLGDGHYLTCHGIHKLVQLVMSSRRLSYYYLCKLTTCDCKANRVLVMALQMQSACEFV
jgi:hypothetical protein